VSDNRLKIQILLFFVVRHMVRQIDAPGRTGLKSGGARTEIKFSAAPPI